MSAPPPDPLPKPSTAWPWILLGLGLLGVGIAAWRPIPAGVWHDDGVYMLVGKAIAGGHGFTYEGVVGAPPAAKFPPLYPLLLGLLWKVFGTIGGTTLAATFLNVGLLAVAGALFAKALHESTDLSLRMSVAAAGLGFASPDLLRTALVPLSESTFMALMAVALALWPQVRSEGRPGRATALLSLVLLATVATRTAGVALVLAFAFAIVLPRGLRGTAGGKGSRLAAAGVAALPALVFTWAWGRWSASASAGIAEGSRDLLGSYGGWLADQTLLAPGAFLAGLPSHTLGVLARVAAIFLPGLQGGPMWGVAILLLPLGLYGIWRMIERMPPLGWFALAYVAMLLLWPYLDRRLVVPLHPVLVGAVAVGASDLVGRVRSRRFEVVVIAAAVLWMSAYAIVTAYRIADGWPSAPYRLRADRLAASVEALSQTAPPDAVIGAPEFWAALHLHGGWTVVPSVRFDPRSIDPEAPMWGTPEEQISHWQASGLDHLLLEQAGRLHGAALDQLEAECPGSVFVLAQMPSALVVKIEWDSTCGA